MIEGKVTGTEAVIARFEALPDRLREQLRGSVSRQGYRLQAGVVRDKLSGQALHRRTGNLASSINVDVKDDGGAIVATVGTNVKYARPHELGGTFDVPAHTRKVTMVFGRPVAPTTAEVPAHTVTFPERSFLRSELSDLRLSILDALRADVAAATKAGA